MRRKAYDLKLTEDIFCANCTNARRVSRKHTRMDETIEKVYCAKDRWKVHSNGKGRYRDFFAVWQITSPGCSDYMPMGDWNDTNDLVEFLSSLPQCKEDMLMPRGCACSPR